MKTQVPKKLTIAKITCRDCGKVVHTRNHNWNHPGCMTRSQAARDAEAAEITARVLEGIKLDKIAKALETAQPPLPWYKRLFPWWAK